jgi:hypothetical protein
VQQIPLTHSLTHSLTHQGWLLPPTAARSLLSAPSQKGAPETGLAFLPRLMTSEIRVLHIERTIKNNAKNELKTMRVQSIVLRGM